jgi:hypothetical protein
MTTVGIIVPDPKIYAYAKYVLASQIGSKSLGAGVASFVAGQPGASLAFLGIGLPMYAIAEQDYRAAVDPADPNYTQFAVPQVYPYKDLGLDVDTLPDGLLKTAAQDTELLESYIGAETTSLNRAQGAAVAGDSSWQIAQLLAASNFANQATGIEAELAELQPALDSYISNNLSIVANQIAGSLQTNGLPPVAVQILQSMSFTPSQIDALRQNLSDLGPAAIVDPTGSDVATSLLPFVSASQAENELQQAVQLHLQQPGQQVTPVPASDQQRLDATYNTLAGSLAGGASVTSLQSQIQGFLADVENVINQTNNFAALQSYLQFGQMTLASTGLTALQVSPVAPAVAVALPASATQGSPLTVTGTFTAPGAAGDQPYPYAWTVTDSSGTVVKTASGTVSNYPVSGPASVPDLTFTPANGGTYTIALQVDDLLGTRGSDTQTLTVASISPAVTATLPASASEGSPVTVMGSFTAPDGAATQPYSYTWTATDASGAVLTTASGTVSNYPASGPESVPDFTFTPATSGTYKIALQVADVNGVAGSDTQVLTVANVAPAVLATLPPNASEGSPVTVTGTFTDSGGSADQPYSYTWTATKTVSGTVSTYPASGPATVPDFSFTPASGGAYSVVLQVADVHGATGTDTQPLTVSNVPPAVTATLPGSASEGSPVTVTGSFTDPGTTADQTYYLGMK